MNGGFEEPDLAVTTNPNQSGSVYRFDVTNANSPDFTGWQIVTGNIDVLRSYWQPAAGAQSIDLYGCLPATIRQKVPTVNGADYTLTFAKAGNPDPGPAVRSAQVTAIDSVTLLTLGTKLSTFDTTGKSKLNMGWVDDTLQFTGTGNDVYIQFSDVNGDQCGGLALDNVRLEEGAAPDPVVPEVGAAVLLPLSAAALAGIGYAVSRRRRLAA